MNAKAYLIKKTDQMLKFVHFFILKIMGIMIHEVYI